MGDTLLILAQQAASGGISISPKMWFYLGFVGLVVVFLILDLGVFHREAHEVKMKEAVTWTIVWVVCAMAFMPFVYFAYNGHWGGLGLEVPVVGKPGVTETVDGITAVKQYFTGYIVEKSLAMDNVFVIAIIFGYFGTPAKYQHRVLFWGILGALLMRGVMIAIGATLIAKFSWTIYIFGGLLIVTAIKMALTKESGVDPNKNPLVRLVRRLYPVTDEYHGQKFLVKIDGRLFATPLLLTLVMIEFTDLIFAVDSIPAIFAVTADPFIVFTSNVFAILGLRALYFCLADLIDKFKYLKPALIAILFFVGVKMLLVHTPYKIGTQESLFFILGILATGVIASLLAARKSSSKQSN